MRRRTRGLPIVLAVAVIGALVASPAAAADPPYSVVASGLDNPRGIDIGEDGRILVAETGAGRILSIWHWTVSTYRAGLPSLSTAEGATGPVGVSLTARGDAFVAVGGGPKAVDPRFASLLRVLPMRTRTITDIAAYQAGDPDPYDIEGLPEDSNPYGIAALGGRALVTDAGNNDLLLIDGAGRIVTVARFPVEVTAVPPIYPFPLPPALPAESVPTSVAIGPDGYWYVGELKGFPFAPGASRIWRISSRARGVTCDPAATSGPCTLYMDGFTSIVDLDFGPDGSLYVVEMVKNGVGAWAFGGDTVGALWKVNGGSKVELAAGALTLPGGVAVGRNGAIYVTVESVSAADGEVVRIAP